LLRLGNQNQAEHERKRCRHKRLPEPWRISGAQDRKESENTANEKHPADQYLNCECRYLRQGHRDKAEAHHKQALY